MRRFAFALAVVTLTATANWCAADDSTSADQQIAQSIVQTLKEHQNAGRLKGFDIDLNVENGRVVLTGNVADEAQHDLAIDAARFVPGVKVVVNDLKIKGETRPHPEQQKKLGANLASMLKNKDQTAANEGSGLLNGLRNAWSQPKPQTAEQQDSVEPVSDAVPPAGSKASEEDSVASTLPANLTGKQIDRLDNPDPLNVDDRHIASGYSAFTSGAAQQPVATISQVSGAAAAGTQLPQAANEESFVATPAASPAQNQLSRWEPREQAQLVAAEPQLPAMNAQTETAATPVSQAVTTGQGQQAQPASAAQPQQMQAVQMVPVPMPHYAYMQHQQAMMQQQRSGVPVAYAASQLPGGQGQVRMAQAVAPQQVQPAPQFIQGTGSGITPARYDHPRMPGYAWPSYAAYPNYAALQYPKQYSAHAWPYIGPFYPYPQVPLGWRKVTLSWDDGWWHLDFKDRGYGPYVTR